VQGLPGLPVSIDRSFDLMNWQSWTNCRLGNGASTEESETNCAIMAVNQVIDYLENGNIVNSVNFPSAEMERNGGTRIVVANKNVPKMVSQISSLLAHEGLNISNMLNRNKDEIAYNIIDIDGTVPSGIKELLSAIEGVVMVRILPAKK
jgi:D-3-phosphoglycerate dehydrogenase